jgi:cytochrome c2
MPRRGKECNACHEGDQVVNNEIYPEMRAIEDEPYTEVESENS